MWRSLGRESAQRAAFRWRPGFREIEPERAGSGGTGPSRAVMTKSSFREPAMLGRTGPARARPVSGPRASLLRREWLAQATVAQARVTCSGEGRSGEIDLVDPFLGHGETP